METKTITNYHVRESVYLWQTTPAQRKAIESNYGGLIDLTDDSLEFVFYRGHPYFMGDCLRINLHSEYTAQNYWHGYFDDTAFSRIVVHRVEDNGYIFGLQFA